MKLLFIQNIFMLYALHTLCQFHDKLISYIQW